MTLKEKIIEINSECKHRVNTIIKIAKEFSRKYESRVDAFDLDVMLPEMMILSHDNSVYAGYNPEYDELYSRYPDWIFEDCWKETAEKLIMDIIEKNKAEEERKRKITDTEEYRLYMELKKKYNRI